ncbi:MAG: SH3 domain-containing protein [Cyanobacteria bacterium J06635_15]
MKKAYWWLAGIVGVSLIVGGSCAVMRNPDSPSADSTVSETATQAESEAESTPGDQAAEVDQTPTPTPDPDQALTDFDHRRLEVIDKVNSGSEFAQFRNDFAAAVKGRDRNFITALIPEDGLIYGFGGPMQPEDLDLTEEDGWFWQELEKIVAPSSCEVTDYPSTQQGQDVWVCPNISASFYRQYPVSDIPPETLGEDEGLGVEFETVIVYGNGVNVRSAPNTKAEVVGKLSNELVTLDQVAMEQLYDEAPDSASGAVDGWTAIVLPNQVRGYVYNQFVYQPLSPRALFEEIDGEWQIVRILAGD